jgi:serine/threonine protein kinase
MPQKGTYAPQDATQMRPAPPTGAATHAGGGPEAGTRLRAAPEVEQAAPGWRADPVAGQILKGRYRLEERIGSGGMGIVFRATDLEAIRLGHSRSTVAIKVLNADLAGHEASLFDEVEKSRQLQQENIVNVYSFEPDDSTSFMVMELLHGQPLDRFVAGAWPAGMPPARALPLIRSMAAALSYAHRQGVIHSDFKPANVFIVDDAVKVLDFGIARAAKAGDAPHAADSNLTAVTPLYASCEMLEEQPADRRDDVFCFGLVVHFLLTGRHPFNVPATSARDLQLPVTPVRSLSGRQNAALLRTLSLDRDSRSASFEELLEALQGGRNRALRIALLSAGMLAVAALGYLYHDLTLGRNAFAAQDSDTRFVLSLCSHAGDAVQPDADEQLVATLLEQGENYLRIGQKPFDPGILSENVSSALGAFQSALALSPRACDAAARGMLKVAMAYKAEARRQYAQGDYRKAAQAANIALRIWNDSSEMRELLDRIARHLPPPSATQP